MTTSNPSDELAHKAVAAAVASIEVYNKPDFYYREETFAILMTNAWELLLVTIHRKMVTMNLIEATGPVGW